MAPLSNVVLVTGMHRSGTTFTGRILSASPHVAMIHEPFNPRYGLSGVSAEYPYLMGACDPFTRHHDDLYRSAIALRGRYRRWVSGDPLIRRLARSITGGEAGASQSRARLARLMGKGETLLVKDPYLMLALRYLVESETSTPRVVATVRHPMAIWRSLQRMGWGVRLGALGGPNLESLVIARQMDPMENLVTASNAEKLGYLWSLLYSEVVDVARTYPDRVLLVRHEDLSNDPSSWFHRLASHCAMVLSPAASRLIADETRGSLVNPDPGVLHQFARDSKAAAWAWTKRGPDDDERMVRERTEPVVMQVYDSWRP